MWVSNNFNLILLIYKKEIYKNKLQLILIFLLTTISPVVFLAITIIAPKVSIYDSTGILMLPTMNYLYLITLLLVNRLSQYKESMLQVLMQWITLALFVKIAAISISFIMAFSAYMQLESRKQYALAISLAEKINEISDYSEHKQVMFGGSVEFGNYDTQYSELQNIVQGTTAAHNSIWKDPNGRQWGWHNYFKQYLGLSYGMCDKETYNRIIESQEYQSMSEWPDNNSIKLIDEITVINLGKEERPE